MPVLEKEDRDGEEELYARPRLPPPVPVEEEVEVEEAIGASSAVVVGMGLLGKVVGLLPSLRIWVTVGCGTTVGALVAICTTVLVS